jgi:hypothetical protein
MLKKKIWANFQRIVEVFTQKIFNMLSNIWVWDPGSEIRDPRSGIRDPGSEIRDPGSGKNLFQIPDPGVKKAPDPGSGSATLAKFFKSKDFVQKNHVFLMFEGIFNVSFCNLTNAHQFYTVSVRTFVIPFYFGFESGSGFLFLIR